MTIPTISTLPTAPARTDPPATFVTRADSFLAALVVMQGELNTSIAAMNIDIAGVNADAISAAADAASAAASASAAVVTANADIWVSGQSYVAGDNVISPTDYQTYRATTATSGTTDPQTSGDWVIISNAIPSQTGNSGKYLTTDGNTASWAGVDATNTVITKTAYDGEIFTSTINNAISSGFPSVNVGIEVPAIDETSNYWNVNSSRENFTQYSINLTDSIEFTIGNISTTTFTDGKTVKLESAREPYGVHFSANGIHMYIVDDLDNVNHFILSTAYDVETATLQSATSVSAQDTQMQGIQISSDGTKAFMCGIALDDIYEYELSTPYYFETATYVTNLPLPSTNPYAFHVKPDGTELYVVTDANDRIYQYTMSTAWDLSTATETANFLFSGTLTLCYGIHISSTGKQMFLMNTGRTIFEFTLTTAWDITTAIYSGNSIAIFVPPGVGRSIHFSSDLAFFAYVDGGASGSDAVHTYIINELVINNTSSSWTSIQVDQKMTVSNGGVYSLTNALNQTFKVISPATSRYEIGDAISFSSAEINSNNQIQSFAYYDFPATNTTWYGGTLTTAAIIGTATLDQSNYKFQPQWLNNGRYILACQHTGAGLAKLFELSIPYDLTSTLTEISSFTPPAYDIVSYTLDPTGTHLCGLGDATDTIYQWVLSEPWVFPPSSSLATYTRTLPTPFVWLDMTWADGGKTLYLTETTTDKLYYLFSNSIYPYQIRSASPAGTAYVTADTNPFGVSFSRSGNVGCILGGTLDGIYLYRTKFAWDLVSATYTGGDQIGTNSNLGLGAVVHSSSFLFGENDSIAFYSSGGTVRKIDLTGTPHYSSQYGVAISDSTIDTTYWTDLNSITPVDTANGGVIYYALSDDAKNSFYVLDNSNGKRSIARNNAGTWQYNSNATYGSETWTDSSQNNAQGAIFEALGTASNRMTSATLAGILDATFEAVTTTLDLAIITIMNSNGLQPVSSGATIDYLASATTRAGVIGNDYEFTFPESTKIQFTAINGGNYKIRVL